MFVALILSACAAPLTRPEPPVATTAAPVTGPPALGTVQVSPRHVNFSPEAQDGSGNASTVAYVFPFIQGQLFGRSNGKQAWAIVDENRAPFSLDLNDLSKNAPAAARPLTVAARESGLNIFPRDTGILRMTTVVVDTDSRMLFPVEVSFRDPEVDTTLMLVYVDRPCRITGQVDTAVGDLVLDVTLHSAGFHWLNASPEDGGRVYVREHANTNSVLMIVNGPAGS